MPEAQSNKAVLFEGHSKARDHIWKTNVYLTYTYMTVVFFMYAYAAPDTYIETWAEAEARARLRLKEEHGFDKFEFGVHYYNPEFLLDYQSKSPDDPFNEDDDDDDDDDEEEEEEGDEEEEDDE